MWLKIIKNINLKKTQDRGSITRNLFCSIGAMVMFCKYKLLTQIVEPTGTQIANCGKLYINAQMFLVFGC